MLYHAIAAIISVVLPVLVVGATDICYFPDGTQTSASKYSPCVPTANVTHCCADGETCLSNGLCLSKNDTSINTGLCTDSTWEDPACFLKCLDVDRDHKLSTLYRCNHNRWCCSPARNSTTCCNDPEVTLFQGTGTATVQNGTAFVAGYSIAPIASIATDSSSSSSSSSDHKAVAAGVGAGLGIGLPLLAVIGVLSFLLFRERKHHDATKQSLPENQSQNQNPRYTDQSPLSPHSQMAAALMQQQQQQNYQIPPLQPGMTPFIPPAYAPPQIPAPAMTSPSTTLFPSEADSSPTPHNVEADCQGTSVSSRPELPG